MNAKLLATFALVLAVGCGGTESPVPADAPSASPPSSSSPSPSPSGASDRLDLVSGIEGSKSAGQTLFAQRCATCHGGAGKGGAGPNLTGVDETVLVRTLINGRAGGMPSFGTLGDQALADLTAFVMQIE